MVRFLIDHGADVNQRRGDGSTPLMEAIVLSFAHRENSLEMAKILIAHKADVTLKRQDGVSALDLAIHNNEKDFAALIQKAEREQRPTLRHNFGDLRESVMNYLSGSGLEVRDLSPYFQAAIAIRPGNYVSSNQFKIEVLKWPDGTYKVRADGVVNGQAQFVLFELDGMQPFKEFAYYGRQPFNLVSAVDRDGIRTYSFKYGGFFSAVDQKISFGIHLKTGELTSIGTRSRVARWSLPPWYGGFHSGPIKKTLDEFNAEGLTRVAESH